MQYLSIIAPQTPSTNDSQPQQPTFENYIYWLTKKYAPASKTTVANASLSYEIPSTPNSAPHSEPFCPSLSSRPKKPQESDVTVYKTADDAAVGNTVPIMISEGTDSFKGGLLAKQ